MLGWGSHGGTGRSRRESIGMVDVSADGIDDGAGRMVMVRARVMVRV